MYVSVCVHLRMHESVCVHVSVHVCMRVYVCELFVNVVLAAEGSLSNHWLCRSM